MLLKVIAIRDIATDAYMPPGFVSTLQQGIRAFQDEVTKPDSNLARHPSDYELYHLGDFDDSSGVFECLATPHRLAKAVDFVKS